MRQWLRLVVHSKHKYWCHYEFLITLVLNPFCQARFKVLLVEIFTDNCDRWCSLSKTCADVWKQTTHSNRWRSPLSYPSQSHCGLPRGFLGITMYTEKQSFANVATQTHLHFATRQFVSHFAKWRSVRAHPVCVSFGARQSLSSTLYHLNNTIFFFVYIIKYVHCICKIIICF